MKTMNVKSLALSIMLATGTLANAEVVNVFTNGDASENPEDDKRNLEREVRVSNPAFLSDFTVVLQLNRKDSSLFGILSTLQNTTSLGVWMMEVFPESGLTDKPELYQKAQDLTNGLQEIVAMDRYLELAITKGTRLWALTQMEKKSITKTLFLNAMKDVDGHHDFITSSGSYANKGLGFSAKEYRLLKVGLKKFNAIEKVVNTFESSVDFFGVIAGIEVPSNNLDYDGMRNFVRNNLNAGNMINMLGHSDGAALANSVLDLHGDYDKVMMMSTGTVDNRVWNNGKNITLIEDIYAHLIPFAMSDEGLSNHDDWYDGVGGFIPANAGKYGYFLGHDFSGVYLYGVKSRKSLIDKYVSNYNILKLADMKCNPDIQSCLDDSDPVNNISIGRPNLSQSTITQGEMVRMNVVQSYGGNQTRSQLANSKVCYRITTSRNWSNSAKVKNDVYSYGSIGSDKVSEREYVNLLVPSSLAPGNYYFGIKANCNSAIDESDFSDNYRYVPIVVTADASEESSDIYITNARLDENTVSAGADVTARSEQRYSGNVSNKILDNPRLGYYLSADRYFSSNDVYLDYDSSSIGSDDLYDSERETLTIPSDTKAGRYYILYVSDDRDDILETDEGNNVAYARITVEGGSSEGSDDIYLSRESIDDDTLYRGQRTKVRVSVNHSGDSTKKQLGRVYTSYYLVTSAGAEYLDYDYSTIGSNDRDDNESERITIPRDAKTGPAFILIVADDRDGRKRISESDESNNFKYIPITIR